MRPQPGVGRLKPAPPWQANILPLVAQAVSPANYRERHMQDSVLRGSCATTQRVLNRFGESWPGMRRKPGTDTNFRRILPEFGCLYQGLPNGTGCPFVVSPKRLSTQVFPSYHFLPNSSYNKGMQGPQTINELYYCLRNKPDGPVSVLTTNSYVVGEYNVSTGDIRWGRVVLASQKVQIQNYLHRHFPPTSTAPAQK